MTLGPGARLGPYEIQSALGAGGMGEVYRAADTNLKRAVAIKVLPESVAADRERLARFQREAEVLASLNHSNIATIYGLERSDGVTALVMEFVDGPTLADRIAQGPIPVDEALPIAKQIGEALEAAHEQGIIHRDLKPANIKLRPDGTVKVLDFGLAKALEPVSTAGADATASPTITSPAMMTGVGVLLGTAAYMSPEQARGKPVDRRSDIWAFGCVLYEMLTGKRAFDGDDIADTLANVLKAEPDWSQLPTDAPARVTAVVRACLRKDPKQRVGDAQTLRLMLTDSLGIPVPAKAHRSEAASRNVIVSIAVLAVGAAGVATGIWMGRETPPARVVRSQIEGIGPATLNIQRQDRNVAITPDGSRLIFRGQNGMYVRSLNQLSSTQLINAPGARTPFVSPDGQWVGYFEGNFLKKVAITGGSPATIGTFAMGVGPRGATWGTDGTIVYAADDGLGLRRVSAAGGEPQTLTTPDANAGEAAHLWPEFLPDRNAVLFTVLLRDGGPEASRVDILDLETHDRSTVLRGGSHGQYARNGQLVFAAPGTLRTTAFDPAELAITGTPIPVAEHVRISPAGSVDAAVSRDGTLVTSLVSRTTERSNFSPLSTATAREHDLTLDLDRTGVPVSLLTGSTSPLRVWTAQERARFGFMTCLARRRSGRLKAPATTCDRFGPATPAGSPSYQIATAPQVCTGNSQTAARPRNG